MCTCSCLGQLNNGILEQLTLALYFVSVLPALHSFHPNKATDLLCLLLSYKNNSATLTCWVNGLVGAPTASVSRLLSPVLLFSSHFKMRITCQEARWTNPSFCTRGRRRGAAVGISSCDVRLRNRAGFELRPRFSLRNLQRPMHYSFYIVIVFRISVSYSVYCWCSGRFGATGYLRHRCRYK